MKIDGKKYSMGGVLFAPFILGGAVAIVGFCFGLGFHAAARLFYFFGI